MAGRKPINVSLELSEVQSEFVPTDAMQRAKCRFWARTSAEPSEMGVRDVAELAGTSTLRKWWYTPGFQDWFANRNTTLEQITYTYQKILDEIQGQINPSINPSQLANLTKSLLAIHERLHPETIGGRADEAKFEQIDQMSEDELRALLGEHLPTGESTRDAEAGGEQ